MVMNPVIFREYDIRGVYEKDYDLAFAENLGRAYIRFLNKDRGLDTFKVAIGYDARLSSPPIKDALIRGLASSGAEVLDLGLITSPMSYFATFTVPDISGAIMVTGSHNPPEYNGFKISAGPTTIFGEDILTLKKYIVEQDFISGDGSATEFDIFPSYVERYKEEFKDLKSVPIVLDCGNGAAGIVARRLYEALGLKPTILFEKPDGTFPNHHPDPTVEHNLVDLKKAVAETGSVVGIGFDGDADRIGVVDKNGRTILGDELLILYGRFVLKEQPGSKIIGDVKCSDRLYADIEKQNGQPIMWKTGHSLIKQKIKTEKAPFGGELSGHIFFADRNYGYDDALYAGLRIVEILSQTGKTISELLADLPEVYNTPELRIDTTEEKKVSIVNELIEKYSKPSDEYQTNLIDGVRVSYKDGWALARASNTQPVLVLRFESTSKEGLARIQNEFESFVNPRL